MTSVRITDSTLRDGSHAVSHQFSVGLVRRVVEHLDRAGVQVIEVSHGDGLGGSSFNYGFSGTDERQLIAAAVAQAKQAKIAVLLLPGIGVANDLREVHELGVQVARIATHCTEADIAEQHIGLAKQLGMEAVGFLMLAHMISPDQLVEQARKMQDYGADCVYVVDSAGALTMEGARDRIAALRANLDCQVGIHAHNNLALAVANSIVGVEEGATQVDGCVAGLGAGAGNCPIEVFAAVCERYGLMTGVNFMRLSDLAEDVVRPLTPHPIHIDRAGLVLGYAGVYSSFLLHAQRAAERFGVPAHEILLECGRRNVVGGQEDVIIEVAQELASLNHTSGGRVDVQLGSLTSESP